METFVEMVNYLIFVSYNLSSVLLNRLFIYDTEYLLSLYIYETEPKCYCTYTLEKQRNETTNSPNEIMCETHGGLQPSGKCGEDEYCAGPNTPKDAVCGKKQLCTKKGIQDF